MVEHGDRSVSKGEECAVAYHLQPKGRLIRVKNDGTEPPPPGERTYGQELPRLATYKSLADANLNFTYVGSQPGDCVVLSKRAMHMSDPRPHLGVHEGDGEDGACRPNVPVDRLAISMRVVIKPPPGVRAPRKIGKDRGSKGTGAQAALAAEAGIRFAPYHSTYAGKMLPKLVPAYCI